MFKLLETSDVHLTDAPADEYRWRVFKSLASVARARKVDAIAILGDLTDRKNHHSDALTNRIVDEVEALADSFPVYILRGNHDYEKDHDVPFFRFLRSVANVVFVTEPSVYAPDGKTRLYFVPHTRSEQPFGRLKPVKADLGLTHFTFKGAVVENGFAMPTGLSLSSLPDDPEVWISGDIHVPQKMGRVVYSGAPHPIRFGDSFEPRFLLATIDGGKTKIESIPHPTIRKAKIEASSFDDLDATDLRAGDQAKVIFELPQEDFGEWTEVRTEIVAWAERNKILLGGVSLRAKPVVVRKRRDDPKKTATSVPTASPSIVLDEFGREKGIAAPLIEDGKGLLA